MNLKTPFFQLCAFACVFKCAYQWSPGVRLRAVPVPRADDCQSAARSRRGRSSPRRFSCSELLWSCDRPDPDWVNFKKQEEAPVRMEMLVVVGHSLLVLLLATPSLHGNAGVWQFPAYGPSPTPLESPTPRVARAAIPKDLVSGITVAHALIIGPRLTF